MYAIHREVGREARVGGCRRDEVVVARLRIGHTLLNCTQRQEIACGVQAKMRRWNMYCLSVPHTRVTGSIGKKNYKELDAQASILLRF